MKQTWMTFFIPGMLFFTNCGDNNVADNEKQSADNPVKLTRENLASARTSSDNGIVGTWKLIMVAYDENFNTKLDDEERKMGVKESTQQSLREYKMQFNANGSCKIEGRYNATYKLNEEGDKKILTIHLEAWEASNGNQVPASRSIYHIKSMTSSELLLLAEVSGVTYTFWLLKKV